MEKEKAKIYNIKIKKAGAEGGRKGLPGGASGQEPACQCWRPKRLRFYPSVRKIP